MEYPPALTLVVERTGFTVANRVTVERDMRRQLLGWIGRRAVPRGVALGLPGCFWVHTFGMRFAIDVVYCDRKGYSLAVLASMAPNRCGPIVRGAVMAWEMAAGSLAPHLAPGDRLMLVSPSGNQSARGSAGAGAGG